jgi:hypothetical protein
MRFFRASGLRRVALAPRSALAVGIGLLGSFAFLFDCGGSAFSGASGGASGAGLGNGGIGQGGTTTEGGTNSGGAKGGKAGASGRGGASAAGSSGTAQGGGGEGGEPPSAGAGGVSEAGFGGDSGGDSGGAPTSVCPAAPPIAGACVSGLICTYGADLRPACRTRYECSSNLWTVSGTACSLLVACLDRDGGVPHPGDTCAAVGEDCTLGDEAQGGPVYCRCDVCVGAACSPKWDCVGPPLKPCASSPPNEGQACDTNGQSCSYGSCSMPANDVETMQCVGHYWQRLGGGCATAG